MADPTKAPNEGTPEYAAFVDSLKKAKAVRVFIEEEPGGDKFVEILLIDGVMFGEILDAQHTPEGVKLTHSRLMWMTKWSYRESVMQLFQWAMAKLPRAVMELPEKSALVLPTAQEVKLVGKKR